MTSQSNCLLVFFILGYCKLAAYIKIQTEDTPPLRICISFKLQIVQDLDCCWLLQRSSLSPNNSLKEVFYLLPIEKFIQVKLWFLQNLAKCIDWTCLPSSLKFIEPILLPLTVCKLRTVKETNYIFDDFFTQNTD